MIHLVGERFSRGDLLNDSTIDIRRCSLTPFYSQSQNQVSSNLFVEKELFKRYNDTSFQQIFVHGLHMYLPRINIARRDTIGGVPKMLFLSGSFVFPGTQFVTVGTYRNRQISAIKAACTR